MNTSDRQYYISLINELRKLPVETEWVEFKVNNDEPHMIGEYLSAISNSAALHERETGYVLYGIHNTTHEIVGSEFYPKLAKVGNEELENWLLTQLTPRIDFRFVDVETDEGHVVLIEIPAARIQPTAFKGTEFIRVGSYKKKLKDFPEKERKLWRSFEIRPYETLPAKENVDAGTITKLLDTGAFYTLMQLPIPSTRDGIIYDFLEYGFLKQMDNGNYAITNMGALLFAKTFSSFDYLDNKAIRVIRYKGSGRTHAIRDQSFSKGYAIGFDEIITYIMSMLPQEETPGQARQERFWLHLTVMALALYVFCQFLPIISRIGYYLTLPQIFYIPRLLRKMQEGGTARRAAMGKAFTILTVLAAVLYFVLFLGKLSRPELRILPYHTFLFTDMPKTLSQMSD